jgi:hypothetical protein
MKALLMFGMIASLAFAQAPEMVKTQGKDLPRVPGPLVNAERLKDLATPFGSSSIDLTIRRASRNTGSVPAVAVPPGNVEVSHQVDYPAGWFAFRVEVAPGEKVKARLRSDHEAWFVVRCLNKMGMLEKGMLQNLIHRGNPEASYTNFKKVPTMVYFVADTKEIVLGNEPYTITFTREAPAPPKGS